MKIMGADKLENFDRVRQGRKRFLSYDPPFFLLVFLVSFCPNLFRLTPSDAVEEFIIHQGNPIEGLIRIS